jgi:hypothetical protein
MTAFQAYPAIYWKLATGSFSLSQPFEICLCFPSSADRNPPLEAVRAGGQGREHAHWAPECSRGAFPAGWDGYPNGPLPARHLGFLCGEVLPAAHPTSGDKTDLSDIRL